MTRVRDLARLAAKQSDLDSRLLRDSNYVITVAQTESLDSAYAKSVIDSDHVRLKQSKNFTSYTGKPTTLSGYGITDTRTTAEIRTASDSAFTNQFVAGAPSDLNTLDKIAAAMNDDSDVFNTLKSFGIGYGYDSATLGDYTQTEQLFEADGVFIVPENVFNIDIWAVGGGGGGQPGNARRGSGPGGGGGAFVRLIGYHVTPGDKLNITVGQAGEQGWTVRPGYNYGSTGSPFGPTSTIQSWYHPDFNYANTHGTASTVYDSSRDIQILSAGGGKYGSYSTSTYSSSTYAGGLGGIATVDSDAKNYYSVSSLAIVDSGGQGEAGGGISSSKGDEGGGGGAAGKIGGYGGHGIMRAINSPPSYGISSSRSFYSTATKGGGIYLYDRGTYGNGTSGSDANSPSNWSNIYTYATGATAASGAGTDVRKAYGGGGSGGTGGAKIPYTPGPPSLYNYHRVGYGSGDSADHGAVRIDWRRYAF